MTFEYTLYHTELEEVMRKGTIEAPDINAVKGQIIAQSNGTSDAMRALVASNVVKVLVREMTEV